MKAHFVIEIIMYLHLMHTAVNQSFGSFLITKASFHNPSCLLSILFVSQQINGNNLIEVFSPISAMNFGPSHNPPTITCPRLQLFKQFHKILLDIFNRMLPTIYTVKSHAVLNCTDGAREGLGSKFCHRAGLI